MIFNEYSYLILTENLNFEFNIIEINEKRNKDLVLFNAKKCEECISNNVSLSCISNTSNYGRYSQINSESICCNLLNIFVPYSSYP